MTDETMLRAYYLDIEQELLARKAFPNCDQNQKRIPECDTSPQRRTVTLSKFA
jgi:hypothetical protein